MTVGRQLGYSAKVPIAALALMALACDGAPTRPHPTLPLASIRYERNFDIPNVNKLEVTFNIPIPNDPFGRTYVSGCYLEPRGHNVFECSNLYWNVPINMDASLSVADPASSASAQPIGSRALFVNNQRVKRVEEFTHRINGTFRLMTNGTLR